MRIKWIVSIVPLLSLSAAAQGRVVADISNFENNKGTCRACLFNDAASFTGEGGAPYRCVQVPVTGKKAQAVFDNVPAGTYALFVLHDANNNNKMDKNFVGIPKEGYGASRNKLPFAAAPTFVDNKFSVQNNSALRLSVRLRNL
jgi:uncharacterized protein (DUF2141 family)